MSISFDLTDRVVLISGGSKGIGKSIALDFLEAGAKVVVCARSQAALEELSNQVSSANFLTVVADATDEKAVQNTIDQTIQKFGKLDILVNNVGGAIKFGDFWSLSKEDWQNAFELNVMSMVFFSRAAIPHLKKSSFPRIINISSISGIEPGFYNPHYTTTKASTLNFSKYLSNLLASEKILVNCICPGSIISDSWYSSIRQIAEEKKIPHEKMEADLRQTETLKIPLGRMGEGDDISKAVLFLASDGASWVTGSCFHLNGGKMKSMC